MGLDLSADKRWDEIALGLTRLWGMSYGITNELSAGLSYDGRVKPSGSNFRGTLALNVGYTYYADGPLILTGNTNFGYDFLSEAAAAKPGENQNVGDTIDWNFGLLYYGDVHE